MFSVYSRITVQKMICTRCDRIPYATIFHSIVIRVDHHRRIIYGVYENMKPIKRVFAYMRGMPKNPLRSFWSKWNEEGRGTYCICCMANHCMPQRTAKICHTSYFQDKTTTVAIANDAYSPKRVSKKTMCKLVLSIDNVIWHSLLWTWVLIEKW